MKIYVVMMGSNMPVTSLLLTVLFFRSGLGNVKFRDTFEEAENLAGKVCLEKDAKLETWAPSVITCAMECRSAFRCVGSSFQASTGRCYGCMCPTFSMNVSDLLPLEGAVFHVQPPIRLLSGRCGNVPDTAITAEYFVGGNYTTPVNPTIKLKKPVSWFPDRPESYYLKIDLGRTCVVYGISVQGRDNGIVEFVTEFGVYGSPDCVIKHYIDRVRITRDITRASQIFDINLKVAFLTQCLFIKPEVWLNYPSLRVDVLGY